MIELETGELKKPILKFYDVAGNILPSVKTVEPVEWVLYPLVEGGPSVMVSEPNTPVVTLNTGSVPGMYGLTAKGRFRIGFPRADLAHEELKIVQSVPLPAVTKIEIIDI